MRRWALDVLERVVLGGQGGEVEDLHQAARGCGRIWEARLIDVIVIHRHRSLRSSVVHADLPDLARVRGRRAAVVPLQGEQRSRATLTPSVHFVELILIEAHAIGGSFRARLQRQRDQRRHLALNIFKLVLLNQQSLAGTRRLLNRYQTRAEEVVFERVAADVDGVGVVNHLLIDQYQRVHLEGVVLRRAE